MADSKKLDAVSIIELDLYLKGLLKLDKVSNDGKEINDPNSRKNKSILAINKALCEYAYVYYLASNYNYGKSAKENETINTNVSRDYFNHVLSNEKMFNWLYNENFLYMCNEALKFRVSKGLVGNALGKVLNDFDLLSIDRLSKPARYDLFFNELKVNNPSKHILPLNEIEKNGMLFEPMGECIEDKSVDKNKYNEETIDLVEEMIEDRAEYFTNVVCGLYESGYQGFTPDGMLNKTGMIAVDVISNVTDKNEKVAAKYTIKQVTNTAIAKFYNWLSKKYPVFSLSNYNGNMRPNYENIIKKEVQYFPHYQARNSCGLPGLDRSLDGYLAEKQKNRIENANQLRDFIKVRIVNTIMDAVIKDTRLEPLLHQSPDDSDILNNKELEILIEKMGQALMTAVVIPESKKNIVFKIKICPGNRKDALTMKKELFEQALLNGEIFSASTQLSYYTYDEALNIITITFMINKRRYEGFPLFAYQAVEAIKRNGKPSWKNVVIGKTIDDKIFTLDLTPNTIRVIPIIAGSRSGKGVMTLNFIANAFALGYPVFYLDCKADMGYTFYDLAQKRGTETFAFDGCHTSRAIPRDYNLFTGYNKLPETIQKALNLNESEKKTFILTLSYVRALKMLDTLMTYRAMAFEGNPSAPFSIDQLGGERCVFVWDEFERFGINLQGIIQKKTGILDTARDNLKNFYPDLKDAQVKELEEYKFFDKLKDYITKVFTDLRSHEKAEWGQSHTTIFLLAQSVNIDNNWPEILSGTVGGIIASSLKVCGRETESGSGAVKYGTGACSKEWKDKLQDKYFVIQNSGGGNIIQESSSLVKGYFLLNNLYDENGNEDSCVVQLWDNLKEHAASVRKEVTGPDGKLLPELAFEGYMRLLADGQDNFGPALKLSWDIGSLMAESAFGYNNLNDYMYDVGAINIEVEDSKELNEFDNLQKSKTSDEDEDRVNIGSNDIVHASDLGSQEFIIDEDEEVKDSGEEQDIEEEQDIGEEQERGRASIFGDLFSNMHTRTDTQQNVGSKESQSEDAKPHRINFNFESFGNNNESLNEGLKDQTNFDNFGGLDGIEGSGLNTNEAEIEETEADDFSIQFGTEGSQDDDIEIDYEVETDFDSDNSQENFTNNQGMINGFESNSTPIRSDINKEPIKEVGPISVNDTNIDRVIPVPNVEPLNLQANNKEDENYRKALRTLSELRTKNPSHPAIKTCENIIYNYEVNHGRIPSDEPINGEFARNLMNISIDEEIERGNNELKERTRHKVEIAIQGLLNRRRDALNKNINWFNLKDNTINNYCHTIIDNEVTLGCEIDYSWEDAGGIKLIIETVLQAATRDPRVLRGAISGILSSNPNLITTMRVRTAEFERRKANINNQGNRQNTSNINGFNRDTQNGVDTQTKVNTGKIDRNTNNNVQRNGQVNVGDLGLDDRTRQFNEMQKRMQQQREQQLEQQRLRAAQAQAQQVQQEQFSINDYESSINYGVMSNDEVAYQPRTPKDNALKVNLRNIKAQVFGLTPHNSVDVSRTRNAMPFKRSTFLSRTPFGAKIYRQEAFRVLLNAIDKQLMKSQQITGFNDITMLIMRDDTILVNNLIVDLNGIIGGLTGRRLSDIVSFKELAKRYSRIGSLELDDDLLTTFCLEYVISPNNSDALFDKLFTIFPLLSTLRVGEYEITRQELMLRAQDRRLANKQARMAEKAARRRNNSMFDAEMLRMTRANPGVDSSLHGSSDYSRNSLMSDAEREVRSRGFWSLFRRWR